MIFRPVVLALTLALGASTVQAEEALTLEQFEAFVAGRTFTFARTGEAPYGIEAYGPNRQVVWAIFDNECKDGTYYALDTGLICFFYPVNGSDNGDCWWFFKNGLGMTAISDEGIPFDVEPTSESVPCIGPLLGV